MLRQEKVPGGDSLAVHWLRLCASTSGEGPGLSDPGLERFHMP